jgi:hypothetical protein
MAERLKPIVVEKPIIVEKPVQPRLATEFVDLTSEIINGQSFILDEDGEGKVEKILLRSPNPNFSIMLQADYGESLQESYTSFQDVGAWQDGSTYVLEITEITFTKNIRFAITTTLPIAFSRIYVKMCISRED